MRVASTLLAVGALTLISACNLILGVDDFAGPADVDGDAGADAAVLPPGKALLRAPRMGKTTGSVFATSSLRPTFTWRTAGGADRYEIAIDDSCQIATFKACLFPSPELTDTTLTATTYTAPSDLAVNLTAPVGRRYYWRVRACNMFGCGDWSDVWYLDVGRLADDVNGDGFGDLVVGIESKLGGAAQVGVAYLAFGRATVGTVSITTLTDPSNQIDARFGSTVSMVGDVNADGYGDVAVGSWKKDEGTRTGLVYLYLGRGSWPATVSAETTRLVLAIGAPATAFGGAISGRGDVNGDGYGDIAIAATPPPFGGGSGTPTAAGIVYIDFGRPTWSFSLVGSELVVPDPAGDVMGMFGLGLGLGDANEDGLADVLTGAPFSGNLLGRAAMYFAPPEIPTTPFTLDTPSVSFPPPAATGMVFYGLSPTVCTSPGQRPTLAIGAPFESMPVTNSGVVRLYAGADPWPATVTVASRVLPEPAGSFLGSMGRAIRCDDITGDGRDDLIVGAPTGDDAGAVYIYDAADALPTAPLSTLLPGGTSGTIGYGLAVTDFNGDGVSDVFASAPNLPGSHAGRVLGWFGRTSWPTTSSTPDVTIDNPSGVMDQRFSEALD